MDENKRKSSRSFELEKGGKHSFNLNKTSVRKFDLAKESDEVGLEGLKRELLADGKIDAEEVNRLREVLYADGKIDQEEADFLFELNDAVSGKQNDSSWKAFFVEAITDYLLNDEKSPGIIDEEEGKWLEEKINNDGKLDTVERALVASLRRKSKSMPQSLNAILSQVASRFNLEKDEVPATEATAAAKALAETKAEANKSAIQKEDDETDLVQLKKEVLADGKIDMGEVELLRKTLYADGIIDEEEANFLFELNDAVSGKKNDPAWNQFFVQAISDYLLKDEKSPGVIDEEEGKWLVEKIGADGQVDGVEKQLLANLKKEAKSMPTSVVLLINSDTRTPAPSTLPIEEEEEKPNGKWKKFAAILVGLAIVGGGAYFLLQNGNEETANVETPNQEIVAGEDTQGQDSEVVGLVSNDEADTPAEAPANDSEATASGEGTDENEGEQTANEPGQASSQNGQVAQNNATPPAATPTPDVQSEAPQPRHETPTTGGAVPTGNVEQVALEVVNGKYGNGAERRRLLGSRYAEIQAKVNEMYRTGIFY